MRRFEKLRDIPLDYNPIRRSPPNPDDPVVILISNIESFDEFKIRLGETVGGSEGKTYSVAYYDEDSDFITVSSELEYREMRKLVLAACPDMELMVLLDPGTQDHTYAKNCSFTYNSRNDSRLRKFRKKFRKTGFVISEKDSVVPEQVVKHMQIWEKNKKIPRWVVQLTEELKKDVVSEVLEEVKKHLNQTQASSNYVEEDLKDCPKKDDKKTKPFELERQTTEPYFTAELLIENDTNEMWTDTTKLHYITSVDDLRPVTPIVDCRSLAVGQACYIPVKFYLPKFSGEYMTYWCAQDGGLFRKWFPCKIFAKGAVGFEEEEEVFKSEYERCAHHLKALQVDLQETRGRLSEATDNINKLKVEPQVEFKTTDKKADDFFTSLRTANSSLNEKVKAEMMARATRKAQFIPNTIGNQMDSAASPQITKDISSRMGSYDYFLHSDSEDESLKPVLLNLPSCFDPDCSLKCKDPLLSETERQRKHRKYQRGSIDSGNPETPTSSLSL